MLNEQATRVAFVQAWQNLVKEAKPGDTLILTFAGHGAQEDDMLKIKLREGNGLHKKGSYSILAGRPKLKLWTPT